MERVLAPFYVSELTEKTKLTNGRPNEPTTVVRQLPLPFTTHFYKQICKMVPNKKATKDKTLQVVNQMCHNGFREERRVVVVSIVFTNIMQTTFFRFQLFSFDLKGFFGLLSGWLVCLG